MVGTSAIAAGRLEPVVAIALRPPDLTYGSVAVGLLMNA